MRILLVYPPRRSDNSFFPPTSLLYVARAIQDAGHEAEILDLPYLLEARPQEFSLLDDSIYEHLRKKEFDLLGLGGVVSTYFFYDEFVGRIRKLKPGVPIVAGGTVGVPIRDVWEKHAPVDYLVEGDGEVAIVKLIDCLDRKDAAGARRIPGVHYRREDGTYGSTAPELIADLDSIPFLSYDLVDHEYYIQKNSQWSQALLPDKDVLGGEQLRLLPLMTSRGCPYTCTFCFHFNTAYRSHSIEYVVENIRFLKRKYGIRGLQLIDDLFTFDRQRTIALCDAIHKADLGVYIFGSGGKPSQVTDEVLKAMKRAGFIRFSYGIESGSQKMLDLMRKKTTVAQNEQALGLSTSNGIPNHANIVFGMPGEDRKTLAETRDFLVRTDRHSGSFWGSWATAYPGTPLFEEMQAKGVIGDTRAYLFEVGAYGTYIRNFSDLPYDELYRAVYVMPLEVDLAYLRRRGRRLAWLKTALRLLAIRCYLRAPRVVQGLAGRLKLAVQRLVPMAMPVRKSSADIERYVALRRARLFGTGHRSPKA